MEVIGCPIFKKKIRDHMVYKNDAIIAINNQRARIQANDLDIYSDYDIDPDVPRAYLDVVEDRIYDVLSDFTREWGNKFFHGFAVKNFFYQQYKQAQYLSLIHI